MSRVSRRSFVGASALVGTAAVTRPAVARDAGEEKRPPVVVGAGSPQYADLARGVNQRWIGTPDWIALPSTTAQVVAAVQRAVDTGRRVAVRGGGHCFENFVTESGVRAVIDLSAMNAVGHDVRRGAVEIGAGARLGEVNEQLFKRWGVALPGGSCPTVGVGGHISGGGYGPLNRTLGLTVDHLYAVEVVVVDSGGTARAVVASRDDRGALGDLWWAHTGGGGGTFGVVTRYWLRSPGASGTDPRLALPAPPAEQLVATVVWPWQDLHQESFVSLLKNYSAWHVAHNAPGDPEADLYSHLAVFHRSGGAVALNVQLSTAGGDPDRRLDAFLAALGRGVTAPARTVERHRLPWLMATQWSGFADRPSGKRIKGKSAYHRTAFDDAQAQALHRHLTRADYDHPGSGLLIAPYGGRVNAVEPHETALAHRDSALMLMYVSEWTAATEDDRHVGFLRDLYEDVYASTGGAPAPGRSTAGAYVNYADTDLKDPRRNRSGVSWQELYFGANHARLRRAKARWDPRDEFRHALSVRAAGRRER
ncbi:FAD-linked oxidase [Streptomyces sp. WAC 04229]|uniref:FAD-binding oxidoreductase n=1 Tax=Streptomyces sp. WAC 04229 TaxID=2203206 RepID=UPI000F73F2AC|nr:FAD-binding protein [Streptomyces sp. WAC 04229]RSN46427.1 FAD-linked oxidase [Streptomyces sp. WAC 04229]